MESTSQTKNQFTSRILLEESKNIDDAQREVMNSAAFSSRLMLNDRRYNINDGTLTYFHRPQHRFTDMSVRNTKAGRIKKIAHPIHNKILFGFANNIVRRLSFEYTSNISKNILKSLDKQVF